MSKTYCILTHRSIECLKPRCSQYHIVPSICNTWRSNRIGLVMVLITILIKPRRRLNSRKPSSIYTWVSSGGAGWEEEDGMPICCTRSVGDRTRPGSFLCAERSVESTVLTCSKCHIRAKYVFCTNRFPSSHKYTFTFRSSSVSLCCRFVRNYV